MTPEEVAIENDQLQRAYRMTFRQPWAQPVLLDLMKFCSFRIPLPDESLEIAEGKRRAFLRIVQFLELRPEQLLQLFAGQSIPMTGDN